MLFENGDKILFIGDSISDYERARPVGEGLFNAWGTSYVSVIGSYLGSFCPEQNLRVVNMGISGNTVVDLKNRWQQDVLAQKPQWVSVLIGINDVWRQFDSPLQTEIHVTPERFRQTYASLIEETLPHVKGMILVTPYFMEPNRQDPMRARMDEYGAIVKSLAEEYHLPFIDLQSAWDDLFTHVHPCSIAWDRIHPNQTGCMHIARTILNGVGFKL